VPGEAKLERTETGLVPADDGWFVVNLADIGWERVEGGGTWCGFEAPSARSALLGIGVHVLWPGETPGSTTPSRTSPPGTAHITVGAGDGPCAILMVGTRAPDASIHYPVEPAAARHSASVETATDSPREAYAGRPPIERAPSPWPLEP
jgi:hypothetical protein